MTKLKQNELKEVLAVCKQKLPGWAYAAVVQSLQSDEHQDKIDQLLKEEGLTRVIARTKSLYKPGELAAFASIMGDTKDRQIIEKEIDKKLGRKVETKKGLADGVPHNGLHAHGFFQPDKTHTDGAHLHLFVLPDGTPILTREDGMHSHRIREMGFETAGEHAHVVDLPDGTQARTEIDGGHGHSMMIETTAFDGTHSHKLLLPTGETIEAILTIGHMPSPKMPPASVIAGHVAALVQDLAAMEEEMSDDLMMMTSNGVYIEDSISEMGTIQRGEIIQEIADKGFFRRGKKAIIGRASFSGMIESIDDDGLAEVSAYNNRMELERIFRVKCSDEYSVGDCVLVEFRSNKEPTVVGKAYLPDTEQEAMLAYKTKKIDIPDMLGFQGPKNAEIVFVGPQPNGLEMARGEALIGPDAEVFKSMYLDPLGLTKKDVRIGFACPIPEMSEFDHYDSNWSNWIKKQLEQSPDAVVVTLGKHARMALGPMAEYSLPHPASIRRKGDKGEVGRKIRQIMKYLDSDQGTNNNTRALDKQKGAKRSADKQGGDAIRVRIAKEAEGEERVLLGVVLDPYRVDAHGDLFTPKDVEQTAYGFMESEQVIKVQHGNVTETAKVVESFIEAYPSAEDRKAAMEGRPHKVTRRQFGQDQIVSGTWILGVRFSEEIYEAFKRGDFTGFSVGALTHRTNVSSDLVESMLNQVEIIDLVPGPGDRNVNNT